MFFCFVSPVVHAHENLRWISILSSFCNINVHILSLSFSVALSPHFFRFLLFSIDALWCQHTHKSSQRVSRVFFWEINFCMCAHCVSTLSRYNSFKLIHTHFNRCERGTFMRIVDKIFHFNFSRFESFFSSLRHLPHSTNYQTNIFPVYWLIFSVSLSLCLVSSVCVCVLVRVCVLFLSIIYFSFFKAHAVAFVQSFMHLLTIILFVISLFFFCSSSYFK